MVIRAWRVGVAQESCVVGLCLRDVLRVWGELEENLSPWLYSSAKLSSNTIISCTAGSFGISWDVERRKQIVCSKSNIC